MKRIIGLLLVLLLCVSLVACGSSKNTVTEAPAATAAATEAPVATIASAPAATPAPAATAAPANGKKYATIDDYLKEPSVSSQLETTKNASKNMGLDAEIYAEGDTLVYDYAYQTQYTNEQCAAMKTQLDNSLNSSVASTFDSVVEELKTVVDEPNPKVKVIYRNADKTVITSKVFTGK